MRSIVLGAIGVLLMTNCATQCLHAAPVIMATGDVVYLIQQDVAVDAVPDALHLVTIMRSRSGQRLPLYALCHTKVHDRRFCKESFGLASNSEGKLGIISIEYGTLWCRFQEIDPESLECDSDRLVVACSEAFRSNDHKFVESQASVQLEIPHLDEFRKHSRLANDAIAVRIFQSVGSGWQVTLEMIGTDTPMVREYFVHRDFWSGKWIIQEAGSKRVSRVVIGGGILVFSVVGIAARVLSRRQRFKQSATHS